MEIKVKREDFIESIVHGVECPICGEWVQVDNISDIDGYICDCENEFVLDLGE